MGMDGLSIANTGVVKESTSAEIASKTEQAMQAEQVNSNRQVNGLSQNQRVRAKDEGDENSKKQSKNSPKDTFEDGFVEPKDDTNADDLVDVEDIENPNKDFYVKLNVKDDIIELYDSATNRLIETISGNELGELVQRLNMASGIFINKKV